VQSRLGFDWEFDYMYRNDRRRHYGPTFVGSDYHIYEQWSGRI